MYNKVILVGRLGKTPEPKTTTAGKVAQLSVATTYYTKNKENDEFTEHTEWHNVVVWGLDANRCDKMLKGDMVMVEGSLKTRSYEKDGVKKYSTEVHGVAKKISGSGNAASSSTETSASPAASTSPEDNTDLPF